MTDIDIVEARDLVIAGNTPTEILANAEIVASSLAELIQTKGLSVHIGNSDHVEVGGWQAAGAMLGALGGQPLHAETVWSRRLDREGEIAYESRAQILTLTGEVVGAAEGLCTNSERTWRNRDEYAIKGMAETRAESRAWRRAIGWVIKLAGYNPTPAEEMGPVEPKTPASDEDSTPWPAWARHIPDQDVGTVAAQLVDILKAAGGDTAKVGQIGQGVFDECDDGFPACLHHLVQAIHAHVPIKASGEPADATDAPTPSEDS